MISFSYGKIPVSIEADVIKRERNHKITAIGNVVIRYKQITIKGDKIVYDRLNKRIYFYGNVILKTADMNVVAEKGWIDEKGEIGEFFQVKGLIERNFYIKSSKIIKEKEKYIFYNGEFSTCSFKQYDWYIKTKKGVFIKDNKVQFFNVSFRFCEIPILYFPYFSYPATGRKSGLLFPEIGSDSYNDFKYVQPFYLVLTRHSDMTLTFDYRNRQGKGLNIEYRNRLSSESFFNSNFIVFNESKIGKWWEGRNVPPLKNRWRVYGKSNLRYDEFDLYFVYDIPSDPYFFEDIYNALNLRYKSYTKTQLIGLLDKKLFTFEVNFDFLYDLTKSNNEETLQRLPEVRFYLKKQKPFKYFPLYIDFLSVNTNFYREKGISGFRSDNILNFEFFSYKGGFSNLLRFSPRGTWYYLITGNYENRAPTRNIFSFEDKLRYTWNKNYSLFFHSLVPEIKFSYVSKVNQENLPYFDREDRIKAAKDIDASLFNILNFNNKNFLSWEMSSGYAFDKVYYLGNREIKGYYKPFKNRIYFDLSGFSGENTFYFDFYFNQIVRSITTFALPVTSWFKYSLSHSFDKGLFETSRTINQISQTFTVSYNNALISYSILNNIKQGYVQRRSLKFILNRKCWKMTITYKHDYNIVTNQSFRSLYVYITILRTDIKLPFVSRTL